jgi:hypothetical protein
MNRVMLVSHSRTYTHFFTKNLLYLSQASIYINDSLRVYSTHNYLESTKDEFSGSIRFANVRDPIECLTSCVTKDAGNDKLTAKRVEYVVKAWVDFHSKLLLEDELNLVWCNDLKNRPLKTFISITEMIGLPMLRDTVIEQENITDFNYISTKTNLTGYNQAYKAISSSDLSEAYKIYSKLVKRSLVI